MGLLLPPPMPPKDLSGRHFQMRVRIAQLAAQLISEHGIRDYGLAKRKAARQLGAPDSHSLPSNDEIEAALRDYQALYRAQEHGDHLDKLRRQALAVMRVLERFDPVLVGSVLTGTATPHADIEIEVRTDSGKEFEQYLNNQDIDFKVRDRGEQAAYLLYADPADVWVRLVPDRHWHAAARPRGEPQQRMNLAQLAQLLEQGDTKLAAT